MRTITTETKVYYFEELPEESQKMAIENYYDINIDYDWYDCTIECWQEKLASIGFDDAEIRFSGFWSQGDGASFNADVDFLNLLPCYIDCALEPNRKQAKRLIALAETGYFDGAFKIDFTHSRYVHENTMTVNMDGAYYLDCMVKNELDEIEENIWDIARGLAQGIYRELEKEYDYLTSEEVIKETLIANEYEFTLDGKIY